MKIVLIAALADNGTIGDRGAIPWKISEDLKRFKRVTLGHPIIMGRKTYESLGRPLPGRTNIVLTRNPEFQAPGVLTFTDLNSALEHCRQTGASAAFVIGGAEIYRQALPLADSLMLTHVHRSVDGDTKFPDYDHSRWQESAREDTPEYSFVDYRLKP
jgi:dihydrofolate reductase